MIELKNIIKEYKAGDLKILALKDVNLNFAKSEFVCVLGPSGCGKTTLLNIIGGLDHYTSGDVIVNGKSTKDFKDSNWDSYRNNSVGFVFQTYNLIGHQTVLENVEIALRLAGISATARKQRAIIALNKMGLSNQLYKKPNQLSGGQMQRVAIARAMVNDPDIILADEPTGALDSETSVQIIDKLKEISNEKLVIMVTHNAELAEKYSTRVVKMLDGKIISDSNPPKLVTPNENLNNTKNENSLQKNTVQKKVKKIKEIKLPKTSMSFGSSLKLSLKNLLTKKGRTIITSFAGSIGIIGIALILAISTGFTSAINTAMGDVFTSNSIYISSSVFSIDGTIGFNSGQNKTEFPDEDIIIVDSDLSGGLSFHENIITDEYIDYLNAIETNLCSSIIYSHSINANLITLADAGTAITINSSSIGWHELSSNSEFIEDNYDLISGHMPENSNQIVMVVDEYNMIGSYILLALGIDYTEGENLNFADILYRQIKLINNDDYYYEEDGLYHINNIQNLYTNATNTLEISGIIRPSSNSNGFLGKGIAYTGALKTYIFEQSQNSEIALAQTASPNIDLLSGQSINEDSYTVRLKQFGAILIPDSISIYPLGVNEREEIIYYLNAYNTDKAEANQIIYVDYQEEFAKTLTSIVNTITYVLIAFTAISLFLSSIMIGIITYISVIERTHEIGILRSLGARKKDIARLFNAETFIVGLLAGGIGILASLLLIIPINALISSLNTGLEFTASLPIYYAFGLIIISICLTLIAGLIPAKVASKKDPVNALRTE
ncbi:MAG: ABC transporter ATP-binding protein/permease [Clostridia bacterium]|jgi:putative ABC transport system permease protein|nr:ABC transporter ATP-binding protein/permease [Clostridia bacterium]